jgi:hypothetical protein
VNCVGHFLGGHSGGSNSAKVKFRDVPRTASEGQGKPFTASMPASWRCGAVKPPQPPPAVRRRHRCYGAGGEEHGTIVAATRLWGASCL